MRDQSVSLRILVLAILLLFVTALCVVALVVVGALSPRIAHMGVVGGTILIVAVLAAAISVFTPKYRPTPLLTPLFAGVFAALIASAAIYGVHAHVASKRSAAAAVVAKPMAEPVKTAPAIENASAAPQEPPLAGAPNFDGSDFTSSPMPDGAGAAAQAEAPPPADAQPAAAMDVPAPPADAAGAAAMDQAPAADATGAAPADAAPVDVANTAPPDGATQQPASAEDATKAPVAVAKIPVPAAAPAAAAGAPVKLTGGFDPSGPTVPQADGPPMALDAADVTQPHRVVIPPLPRIRPCGGAGPACP